MLIYLIKENNIESFKLPYLINGSYWIFDTDINGNKRSLVKVVAAIDGWKIESNDGAKISISGHHFDYAILNSYSFCSIDINQGKENCILYCSPQNDESYQIYDIDKNIINIGKNINNEISYDISLMTDQEAIIYYENNNWFVKSANDNSNCFLNKKKISKSIMKNGDILFIMGLKIFIIGNKIVVNNPNNQVKVKFKEETKNILTEELNLTYDKEIEEKDNYFFKSPRFISKIVPMEVKISPPPEKPIKDKTPLILTIGPAFTMGIVSFISAVMAIKALSEKSATLDSSIVTITIAVVMCLGAVLWPTINQKYQNKVFVEKEKLRNEKYKKYINNKISEIKSEIQNQKNILIENSIPVLECQDIILKQSRKLWERKLEHTDFLSVRLGTGNTKPNIKVNFPEEQFTLYDDELLEAARKELSNLNEISDVPINLSLKEKYITALVGSEEVLLNQFMNQLIIQIITFQSYEDVKIVVFTNEKNIEKWNFAKLLPHCWSNDKSIRFIGSNLDNIKKISSHLEEVFNQREDDSNSKQEAESDKNQPYYLIISDDFKSHRGVEIVKKILKNKKNYGFSLLIQNKKLAELPNECLGFVNIERKSCGYFENELTSNKQLPFIGEFDINIQIDECARKLSNIEVNLETSANNLPKVVSFLQMYNVGNVGQLNILNRWKENDSSISLSVPVGIDENNDLFKLDLHEKYHGPHGLVAGMTGSGKSEFIITYILSLAVNYSPEDVNFVLIDYKGGGLAGAFYNKENNIKLPHLSGIITNLETSEIKRTITSIDSELKRRQRIFNEVREKSGESTIDIYKYQKLYKDKKVKEPIPHLFIISDEFAELKSQAPEFLDNLISIARIGRSLGIHLILATQKPSGVVNEQIWSNAKFRVCFKVQNKSDSYDMLKREEAATLKEVGRFYLQVGYNELFKIGQSAWCGMKYEEKDHVKKSTDTSINFINEIGYSIRNINYDKKNELTSVSGDELQNIVSYLNNISKDQNNNAKSLWLDSISPIVKLSDLKPINLDKEADIKPIIGIYDIPSKQKQEILTFSFKNFGNTLLYGSATSGKEMFLNTLIYSTINDYSANQISIYVLDFGAEMLKMFAGAPQIGDVVSINDSEKINNLFKMLKDTISERKKLFEHYNDYFDYCSKNEKTVPLIFIVLNNYEIFSESYPSLEETLVSIARDCVRYGIVFLVTVSSATGIRYNVARAFSSEIVLQLNDPDDYAFILSGTDGLIPSKYIGRGLIKFKDTYEFQTASICLENENISDIINKKVEDLKTKETSKALKIPILPDKVEEESLDLTNDLSKTPIGIRTDNFKTLKFDFNTNCGHIITGNKIKDIDSFILSLANIFAKMQTMALIIDADKSLKNTQPFCKGYYDSNFDIIFDSLKNYIEKIKLTENKNTYQNLILIISNMNQFVMSLSEDRKLQLEEIVNQAKSINKVKFIFVDNLENIKTLIYESWFTNITNLDTALWYGSGLDNQVTIKLEDYSIPKYVKETQSIGYAVITGKPRQVKFVESKSIIRKEEQE